jgi:hypothetical protein
VGSNSLTSSSDSTYFMILLFFYIKNIIISTLLHQENNSYENLGRGGLDFFLINVGVRVSLCIPRLIPRVLKLTTI